MLLFLNFDNKTIKIIKKQTQLNMEPNVNSVTEIAQGISNFGMMVIVAAFFLILSASLMVACFKWFKSLINNMIQDNSQLMNDLLEETRKQKRTTIRLMRGATAGDADAN